LGFLLPPFGLSLAETELARDIPLLSSPSAVRKSASKTEQDLAKRTLIPTLCFLDTPKDLLSSLVVGLFALFPGEPTKHR
jgi:hypothetical protein